MKTIAGIDLGTQSMKVLVYDFEAMTVKALTRCPLSVIIKEDGTREQTAGAYAAALKKCFQDIPEDIRSTITAIGVSGQQHGFVPLDKNGEALYNVKIWSDTSTEAECTLLTELCGGEDAVIAEINNLMLTGYTAPKIAWLKKAFPDRFKQLRYVLLPHDYINWLLTGSYTMEAGDASGTALFNPVQKTWSKKMCDAIDMELIHLLPPVVSSDSVIGTVTGEAAALLGIPAGIAVSAGGGDNMMSAIGTGTVRNGVLTASLGTSGTLFGYADRPLAHPQRGIAGFCSSTNGWLPLCCTMNCTVATEKVRNLFQLSLPAFEEAVAASPAGAEGLIMLPFFNGERFPPLASGQASLHGLNTGNMQKEHLCRASMEAALFSLYGAFTGFTALGFRPEQLILTGGGAKSILWQKIAADITGIPVQVFDIDETAAFGAVLQALRAVQGGSIESITEAHLRNKRKEPVLPDAETHAQYQQLYQRYAALVRQCTR